MQKLVIDCSTGVVDTVPLTAEELAQIAAAPQPDPKDAIRAQIVSLEREQLMPRATREFMLAFMELNAPAEVLQVNPGYQAVKAFDNQIKALRDLL